MVKDTTPDDDFGAPLLQKIEVIIIEVPIQGITPLIPHKWSEKAKKMMLEKQSGSKARAPRDAKDPEAEAEASLYRLPDGRIGFPSVAFKAAMIAAVRMFDGLTMTSAKQMFFVQGVPSGDGTARELLLPVEAERALREDTPRNQTGVADLRYRYELWPWSAKLRIEYASRIDQQSVLSLLDAAGNFVGVGDWRPSAPRSATGTYGRWETLADEARIIGKK
jgi:hypothetical protein